MSRLLNTARYTSCCVLVSTESLVELSEIASSGPYQYVCGSHSEQAIVVAGGPSYLHVKGAVPYLNQSALTISWILLIYQP
jgi:hypothetical protein